MRWSEDAWKAAGTYYIQFWVEQWSIHCHLRRVLYVSSVPLPSPPYAWETGIRKGLDWVVALLHLMSMSIYRSCDSLRRPGKPWIQTDRSGFSGRSFALVYTKDVGEGGADATD